MPMIRRSAALRRLWLYFRREQEGVITVEAAIVLPGMLAIALLMVSLIQIAAADVALRAAVSETSKGVAQYWAPVRMVYGEAKAAFMNSSAGQWTQKTVERLEEAKSELESGEEWVLQYESLLPDPAVQLVKWEMERRKAFANDAKEAVYDKVDRLTQPLLCKAFEPLLNHYANDTLLDKKQLTVESVRLPGLEEDSNAYVAIEASYKVHLPVPFLRKTIVLHKKSVERAWVGGTKS